MNPESGNTGYQAANSAKDLHPVTMDFRLKGTRHRLFRPLSMNADKSSLGCCPHCGERIPTAWLLVEYTKDNGQTGIWAECPDCADVVAPE